jgi:hypothetical protein
MRFGRFGSASAVAGGDAAAAGGVAAAAGGGTAGAAAAGGIGAGAASAGVGALVVGAVPGGEAAVEGLNGACAQAVAANEINAADATPLNNCFILKPPGSESARQRECASIRGAREPTFRSPLHSVRRFHAFRHTADW